MKPTCLFVGRFQPFHIGHMMVVEGMVKVCGRVVIGIAGAEKGGTADDPFSAAERKEMIQRSLQAKDIIPMFDIDLIEFPDHTDDEKWTAQVMEKVGRIDKVWTGDEWTKKCFEGKIEIQTIKPVPGFSGADIRQRIKDGKDWEDKVPEDVYRYILSLKA